MYELEGTIKVIFDTMTFNSGFTKREFVVTTTDQKYPQDIKLQCVKEKTETLDSVKAGDKVKGSFWRGNMTTNLHDGASRAQNQNGAARIMKNSVTGEQSRRAIVED